MLEQNSHISPPFQRPAGRSEEERGDAHRILAAPVSLAVHPGCCPTTRTERRGCCTSALRQASRRLPTSPTDFIIASALANQRPSRASPPPLFTDRFRSWMSAPVVDVLGAGRTAWLDRRYFFASCCYGSRVDGPRREGARARLMPIGQPPHTHTDRRQRKHHGNRDRQVVQRREGLWFISPMTTPSTVRPSQCDRRRRLWLASRGPTVSFDAESGNKDPRP